MLQELHVHHHSTNGVILQLPSGSYGRLTSSSAGGDSLAQDILKSLNKQPSLVAAVLPEWKDDSGYMLVSLCLKDASSDWMCIRDPTVRKLLDSLYKKNILAHLGCATLCRVTKRTEHGAIVALPNGIQGIAVGRASSSMAASSKEATDNNASLVAAHNDKDGGDNASVAGTASSSAHQVRLLWYDVFTRVATCSMDDGIVGRSANLAPPPPPMPTSTAANNDALNRPSDAAGPSLSAPLGASDLSLAKPSLVTILSRCSGAEKELDTKLALYVAEYRRGGNAAASNDQQQEVFASELVYVLAPAPGTATTEGRSSAALKFGGSLLVTPCFVPSPSVRGILPFSIAVPADGSASTLHPLWQPVAPVGTGYERLGAHDGIEALFASKAIAAFSVGRTNGGQNADRKRGRGRHGDNDDNDDNDVDPRNRLRKRKIEEALDRYERRGEQAPASSDEFDKLLLAAPNASLTWTQYMAYYIVLHKVDMARNVAERALKTMAVTESKERLNVWVAYMNLENLHGTAESLTAVFRRALQQSDNECLVHERLADIFAATKKKEQHLQLCQTMTGKFRAKPVVWERYGQALIDYGRRDQLKRLVRDMSRGSQLLTANDQVQVISQLAIYEYRTHSDDATAVDHGRSLFESLIAKAPKRSDLWNVYLDQELSLIQRSASTGSVAGVRTIFSRVSTVALPPKSMQRILTRYLKFEKEHGTASEVEKVKAKAKAYVESKISAGGSTGVE